MQRNRDRIFITHVGSLARTPEILEGMRARESVSVLARPGGRSLVRLHVQNEGGSSCQRSSQDR